MPVRGRAGHGQQGRKILTPPEELQVQHSAAGRTISLSWQGVFAIDEGPQKCLNDVGAYSPHQQKPCLS